MSKKNISAIVSGAGLLTTIWTELDHAVRERGGSDEDLYRLNTPVGKPIIAQLADIIVAGGKEPTKLSHPFSHGFTVLEDVVPSNFKVSDLELVPILKPEDNGNVNCATLRARAINLKANLGLVDAKYILDHQTEIPSEFRTKALVFAGTLLRDSDGYQRFAYLCWGGGCWRLGFDWVDGVFDGNDRLVRCKS